MSADVIKSGFATTGIFPCNRMAITDDQLLNQRKYASLVMEYPGKYKADKETSTDDLQLFIDNNSGKLSLCSLLFRTLNQIIKCVIYRHLITFKCHTGK